ncbi:MAG: 3-methyladenine DNA glycosylase [Verrucomicrobia bacterium]|nr:3-methyladenine DNA glycosylase [Verrucomicrobiota bacterium]
MQASFHLSAATILPEAEWRARQAAHEARVRVWTDPHQARAARGERHPVHDFLFHYYAFRPASFRRWHPGPDLALAGDGAREFLRRPEYREIENGPCLPTRATPTAVILDCATLPPHRREFVAWLRTLLTAMQTRPPFFACHGLHEWAMVYRQTPEEVRHNQCALRYPPGEIARITESLPVCCSHFDAFRFFTAPARPLNRLQPTRADVPQLDQRGCLHANMDLYKWAFKLAPFTPSELTADCFALAWDIRAVDMRASPYDVRALGFPPIPIETPEGRADYERHQRAFTARGEPLRARLVALCERLLAV